MNIFSRARSSVTNGAIAEEIQSDTAAPQLLGGNLSILSSNQVGVSIVDGSPYTGFAGSIPTGSLGIMVFAVKGPFVTFSGGVDPSMLGWTQYSTFTVGGGGLFSEHVIFIYTKTLTAGDYNTGIEAFGSGSPAAVAGGALFITSGSAIDSVTYNAGVFSGGGAAAPTITTTQDNMQILHLGLVTGVSSQDTGLYYNTTLALPGLAGFNIISTGTPTGYTFGDEGAGGSISALMGGALVQQSAGQSAVFNYRAVWADPFIFVGSPSIATDALMIALAIKN